MSIYQTHGRQLRVVVIQNDFYEQSTLEFWNGNDGFVVEAAVAVLRTCLNHLLEFATVVGNEFFQQRFDSVGCKVFKIWVRSDTSCCSIVPLATTSHAASDGRDHQGELSGVGHRPFTSFYRQH